MRTYLGLNRRTAGDRRVLDSGGAFERRFGERRRRDSDRYVLVLGNVGIDRFGLLVGLPVALLIASALISSFA